jgi:Methyltransferase domain
MPLLDSNFARAVLTHDAPWCGSHGANDDYLGMGLIYYSLTYVLRARVAVCLGSGGGFVPRLMRQAQRDLAMEHTSKTILVDGNLPEAGWGSPAWLPPDSFFRRNFSDIEIVLQSTLQAADSIFAAQGMEIDYLHIDADHSFEGCLADFVRYRCFLREGSVVTLHDTRFDGAGVRHVVEHLRARADCEVLEFPDKGAGTAIVRIAASEDKPRIRPPPRSNSSALRAELLANSPALAPAGRSWGYLESDAFSVRSMIAASFMRDCDTVVELGAGKASIDRFLAGEHQSENLPRSNAEILGWVMPMRSTASARVK